jgi:beta-glucosidase
MLDRKRHDPRTKDQRAKRGGTMNHATRGITKRIMTGNTLAALLLFALSSCSLKPSHSTSAGSGGSSGGGGDASGGAGASGGGNGGSTGSTVTASGGISNNGGASGRGGAGGGGAGSNSPSGGVSGSAGHGGAAGASGGASGAGGAAGTSGGASGGSGGDTTVADDPTCSSFTATRVATLTPQDPQAKTKAQAMSQSEKITMLSGDKTPDYTTANPFRSYGVSSQGITEFPMRDGPRGLRTIDGEVGTTWAVAAARAASFDLDLEYQVGKYQGLDMRAAKDDLALSPTINTLRHPRWARAQETYGEDPVLQGEMGAAYVRGMQQEGSTAACPKHFVGNDTDDNRATADPAYDEQTLRENYARPFEIVVKKGDPACIMAAYNLVNDTHCTENKHLLTDILRTDWGWTGFVLTDWDASVAGHGAASMSAGLDLEMPDPRAFTTLASDLSSGALSGDALTQSVVRILNARMKMKNFDSSYVSATKSSGFATKAENVSLAERTEVEGAVLLKNDGILPLGAKASTIGSGSPDVKTIAIVGPDNNLPIMPDNGKAGTVSGLGDRGSSQTSPPHVVSYFQGLTAHGGITVKQSADASAASGADVVIIPVSMAHEDEGEAYGGGADRKDLTLSGAHPSHWTTKPAAFIKSVAATNPNIIVLLNIGGAVIVEDWIDNVKAVIQTFYPGQEGGTALAKLLFDDANFSGKLPFTVGKAETDYPPFGNSGSSRFTVDYLHGYRHFEKNAKPVRYWFGYGQSYTTYKYSNLKVLCSSVSTTGRLNVQVTVANTGKVAGDEIVQLYVGYPNTTAPKRPPKELKVFTRVTLAAGESKDVQLSVPAQDTAYWSTTTNGWVVEKVAHKVYVGPSADPASLLSADFTIR